MLYKYNNTNIVTKFIKNLLASVYVPSVSIWKLGDYVLKGQTYITKQSVLKCIKTGQPQTEIEAYKDYFQIVQPYVHNKFYRGITSNYISNTSNYDAMTHYYLGVYLRYLRDIEDLNLMSLYNCWDGSYSDRVRIQPYLEFNGVRETTKYRVISNNKIRDGYKTLIIPISTRSTYSIYLNTSSKITLATIYYDGIKQIGQTQVYNLKNVYGSTFNEPIKYRTSMEDILAVENLDRTEQLFGLSEYLSLIIQIPESDTNNIVIIENDVEQKLNFIDNKYGLTQIIYGNSNRNLTNEEIERKCKGYPSLCKSTQGNIAFSSRLIEYLLLNVITSNEEIDTNISRVQKYISSYIFKDHYKTWYSDTYDEGIWTNQLRAYLYDTTLNEHVFDNLGYVDKDIETFITWGQDV